MLIMGIKKKHRTIKRAWKSSGSWATSFCGRDLPNSKACGCIHPDLREKTK